MNLLRSSLALASLLLGQGHARALQARDGAAPAAAAAYQTTSTKVSVATHSQTAAVQWISPRVVTMLTTISATSLIPGPVTALPATVVETVISRITFEFRTTYAPELTALRPTTSYSSVAITVPHTWVVSPARPSHLARAASVPCGACATGANATTAGRCDAQGLRTGCQRQCEQRDGAWWCYRIYTSEYSDAGLRMGRACWGPGGRYEQLNEPCEQGDYAVGCVACKGVDDSWSAINWSGPAGNP